MHILHLALGGCLKAPPVTYGLTEDTGGHIGYVLGAAAAQSRRADTRRVDIVTRGFDDPRLGPEFAMPREVISAKSEILRLFTANRAYLDKGDLAAELPRLETAFLDLLGGMTRRPDVIHAHFSDAARLALAAKERFGIPFCYTPHSLGIDKRDAGKPGAALDDRIGAERLAITEADAIIGSSRDETERQVVAYGLDAAGRTHCVPPGISLPPLAGTESARALIRPFLRDLRRPIVLAVARPVAKKNLPGLVEAFARHDALRARANLVILAGQRDDPGSGNPEQRETIRALLDGIDRHDLWGRVALPRRHRPGDVPGLYALAAESGGVFVNPAFFEPFGLTLVEAASFGLPVVATRHGGPAEIVAEIGHGRLVDPRDPMEIGSACHDLISDRDAAREARSAARSRSGRYSWSAWAARSAEIYAQVAHRARHRPAPSLPQCTRILACDIDGTLTGSERGAVRFADWVRARDPSRLRYAVATGRSIGEARRVLSAWALPEPDLYITSVGSEIWRPRSGGAATLCRDYARRLDRNWARHEIAFRLASIGAKPQAAHEQRNWKLSYFGDAEEARRIEAALVAASLPARVIASHGRFIDVLPRGAGKAAAIAFEAERAGLTLSACIAAGDSGNDLDMLSRCGNAIVPANGLPEIAHLEAAGRLVRTRRAHADGVLEGLVRMGLVRHRERPARMLKDA
ncbi:sucrose-phosphate synthase [Palleronia aestuarii]|uniref:sucrose-phosphate synthase n=1 Tax=Palleronia aestuarii TaxID=568105 RepID=A0A2W7N781_9RHOB|nr:HAD-IIB family hydrolase [Palleronia aestuarii]PZX16225.1 sucrose-phosphate synthase [Palleronia aestuarii]